jgi:hypothetical protein
MPTYFPMNSSIDTYTNNLNKQHAGLENLLNFKNSYGNTAAYKDFSGLMQEYTYNPNQTPLWEGTQNMLHTYINKGNDYVQTYGNASRFTPTPLNHKKIDLSTLSTNNTATSTSGASNITTTNTNTNNTGTNNATSKPVASSLWDPAFNGVIKNGSAEDRAKIAGMENTLENYKILNKMYEDTKPGFFGNIWDRITEEPGAFIGGALDIWNSIRANDLAKDYSSMMRDSFNLQKQQYLDREDRAKQEFAALQSRRAGSSL